MRYRFLLALLGALVAIPAIAQVSPHPYHGNITAAGTDCTTAARCVVVTLPSATASATIAIDADTGSFSGTLQFEGSVDGTAWIAMKPTANSSNTNSSTTATGSWQFNPSSYIKIRVRASARASGTAAITINWATATASNGGGAAAVPFAGVPSGACNSTDTAVDTTTGAFYDCSSGTWNGVGPGAAGAVALNSVTNPTLDKAFDMTAHTLNFNISANTATANPFSFTDFATNTGTGYLFTLSSGSSSAIKPFRVCYRGTTDCANMDTTLFTTSGAAKIDATKLLGNLPALDISAGTGSPTLTGTNFTSIPWGGIAAGNQAFGIYYGDRSEIAAPANPAALTCREYVDSTTHKMKFLNSAGGDCGPAGSGGGITNSAGANVVTKSDGTNIIASSMSDVGGAVTGATTFDATSVGGNFFPRGTGVSDWYVKYNAGAGNTLDVALGAGNPFRLGKFVTATFTPYFTVDTSNGNTTLAAGASIGSSDTGTPKFTFGTNLITANQPFSVSSSGSSSIGLGTDNVSAGSLVIANGSAVAHTIWGSAATTTNTILGPATVINNGHLADCSTSSTTCTLHDSGVVTANVVNASSPGAGIAHFAGSTQTVTSSGIVIADITDKLGDGTKVATTSVVAGTLGCAQYDVAGKLTNTGSACGSASGLSNPMTTTGDIIYASNTATPATPARLAIGSATQTLHGGTTPAWGATSLTADVSGILPVANGGTNNAFFTVSGPASSAKTYTYPNANATMSYTVASGTSALATGAISSAACATVVTTTATGTATTDVIAWGFNGDPTGVTGYTPVTTGALTIFAYPSADNVNFKVCNLTGSSITPGAITLNWRVAR